MKHIRKLVSLLLVLALALAISPSAFAADWEIEASLTNGRMNFSTIKADLREQVTKGSPSYITNLFVETAQGTLFLGYVSEADPGAGVARSQNYSYNAGGPSSIDNITFIPKSGYNGIAKITYTVFSTTGNSYDGTIIVKVEQQEAPIAYSSNGEAITFQVDDFSAWCQSVTGRSVSSMSFTPPDAKCGTLYYDYIDANTYAGVVDSGTQYFAVRQPYISRITFIPAEDYSGSFYISFSATDTANVTSRGKVLISISGGSSASGSDFDYSMTAGQSLSFRLSDFSDACRDATGYDLDYVRFTSLPSSSRGKLYYNTSTAVKTTTNYYYDSGSPLLENVSFVADSGYEGTVTIPFTGFSTSPQGTSFRGVITIEVSGGGSASFSYTVRAGQRVYIDEDGVDEISDACYEITGYRLSHVRFTSLPASSRGVLYHNSTKVSTGTSYYVSGDSNLLENVNFLADDSYEGTFTIPFTGYSSYDGKGFSGTLYIEVTDAGSSSIRYTVRAGQRLGLNEDDFSDMCTRKTNHSLNYVRFNSLPASSRGVFYENGSTAVTTSTNYYLSDNTHLLENISFVADANYSGTFSVGYTCYSSGGTSYKGDFSVTVTPASPPSRITYYTSGPAAKFSSSDFSLAVSPALSDTLSLVRFDEPDSSAGKMCYAYTSPASHGTYVPRQSYSAALLSQISFLPRAGYSGTVSIPYTATDRSGNSASGTIYVVVTPPLVSANFNDMGSSSWAVPAVDFLNYYQIVNGIGSGRYDPTTNMRRGDFILMLSRAYAFPSAGTASFPDVPQDSYYAAAIASARTIGIAAGDSSGRFYPNDPISRQDAAVLLYRCMTWSGQSLTGAASSLSGFSDSGKLSSYAADAMAALVRFGVFQGDGQGLLRPTSSLTRAEMAAILYRAVTY